MVKHVTAALFFTVLVLSFIATQPASAVTTLGHGVNLTDWLNTDEAYYVQTTRYSKKDFQDLKALGFDHVRIYVNFTTYENTAPEYQISPIFITCLNRAINWASEVGLKVVIANTGEEITNENKDVIKDRLIANWKNVAKHYAAQGDVVLYEILVRPTSRISAENWNGVAAEVIKGIREVDATHTIVVGPVALYSIDALGGLAKFDDANILYAFEMFDPILFTRQGQTVNEVAYNTVDVPFPYEAAKMPAMDAADQGTLAADAYNNYANAGTADYVKQRIDLAAKFASDNGVPVWCARFGTTIGTNYNSTKGRGWYVPDPDRNAWHQAVVEQCAADGIAWTLASYRSDFGIFYDFNLDPDVWMFYSAFPYDVNAGFVGALGLAPPPPEGYAPDPLAEGITIFDDEATELARVGWWLGDGEPNFFVENNPVSGPYCMGIFYPGQYNAVDFFFPLYLDMSLLAESGYVLDFFIRCDDPTGHIEARFEDANEDLEERPWRMNYHIDNTTVPFNGEWQRITLPLADMQDQGAWDPDDRSWYNPEGLFDWAFVQRFQFVSETAAQPNTEIYIDRVRIVSPTSVEANRSQTPDGFRLEANYPNPFNPATSIEYSLAKNGFINLSVYNVRGALVKTLERGNKTAGVHRLSWDGTDNNVKPAPSGVYFYELKVNDESLVKRMLLMR